MELVTVEYPAMIYKSTRNNVFVANCIMKNVLGFGKTEAQAIENLEKSLAEIHSECFIRIKPMYRMELRSNNA